MIFYGVESHLDGTLPTAEVTSCFVRKTHGAASERQDRGMECLGKHTRTSERVVHGNHGERMARMVRLCHRRTCSGMKHCDEKEGEACVMDGRMLAILLRLIVAWGIADAASQIASGRFTRITRMRVAQHDFRRITRAVQEEELIHISEGRAQCVAR